MRGTTNQPLSPWNCANKALWFSLGLLTLALLVAGLCLYAWLLADLPPAVLPSLPPEQGSIRFYDRYGRLLYEAAGPGGGKFAPLPLEEIPLFIRQATIATEDATFYTNPGVDFKAILRAIIANLRGREFVMGASTITQQVARNFLLSPEERHQRTIRRKLREAILAWLLTHRYSKDEILAYYLNHTYYGNFAYGIGAAAEAYFGKSVGELSLAEGAILVGLPQAPATYNPLENPRAAKARQKVVLDLMVKHGYITPEEARLAYEEKLHFAPTPFPIQAPHFVFYVKNLLEGTIYGSQPASRNSPLKVYTTLDLDLQREAEAIVRMHLGRLAEERPPHHVTDAALVALDPRTGEILAMVGSPDFFDASISGAVNMALAPRQPGSAFKPLTYAVALEKGFTPATMLLDVRTTFITKEGEPYTPQNYDRHYHGPVLLRDALGSSLNVPAVKVLEEVGLEDVLDLARKLGITTLQEADRYGLSLTLGGGEVRLLELTAAYAAFANGGYRVDPIAILRVENAQGKVLWEAEPRLGPQVLDERVAYLITHILSDDYARLLGFGRGSILNLSRPAAVKTGTTTDWRDNWTVGFTPQLVVGVWVGNADHSPMYEVTGLTGAAPIWHNFMEKAHQNLPVAEFPRPSGLVEREVCALSGKLPNPYCPHRRRELFIAGTEPTETCTMHRLIEVDVSTGLPASPRTPPERRVKKVITIFPPEAREWAREQGLPVFTEETLALSHSESPPLIVLNPPPNALYRVDPSLPWEEQQLEILVESNGHFDEVELLLDGGRIAGFKAPPYRLLWPLKPGRHTLIAIGYINGKVAAKSEPLNFEVVKASPPRCPRSP
ncbi:MAG TPA: penicillin-binding protein 1C [Chloroflexi bacterium]|nr:penicillin-binding protein 1C [Chloroflexota bacterium]